MALITRCPVCGTRFKVVPDQLRISDGWVRCGECGEVFDASAELSQMENLAGLGVPAALPPSDASADANADAHFTPTDRVVSAYSAPAPFVPTPWTLSAPSQEDAPAPWQPPSAAAEPVHVTEPWHEPVQAWTPEPGDDRGHGGFASDPPAAPRAWTPAPADLAAPQAFAANTAEQWRQSVQASYRTEWTAPDARADHGDEPAPALVDSLDAADAPRDGQDQQVAQDEEDQGAQYAAETEAEAEAEYDAEVEADDALEAGQATLLARVDAEQADTDDHADDHADDDADDDDEVSQSLAAFPADMSTLPEDTVYVVPPPPAEVDAALDDHRVSFIKRDPEPELGAWHQRPAVGRGLMAVAALLTAALAVQAAVLQRDHLAAQWPATGPVLQALCAPLGCVVQPLRQIESIVIDNSTFTTLRHGVYRLNVVLKNRAATELAVPAIELALTDTQEQPVLRRVLQPADMAAASSNNPTTTPIAANGEWTASLELSVADEALIGRIVGYRLLAFYP
ncbi:MAG: hypothetical protein JWP29_4985 [Rhodoferax sp.]|nr:hypothetical protein [Rhodoferax sp.]